MLKTLTHLLSLIRFSHTLFALPFALMSAVMAWWIGIQTPTVMLGDIPHYQRLGLEPSTTWQRIEVAHELGIISWKQVLGILLCMVFARSAAMAFNRLVDRRIDAGNPRTAGRHIPAGILSVGAVTAFTVACAVAFIASTLLFLPNKLPLYLSIPVLAFLCGYSLTKRFTSLAHFWLGAALALSPIAAWIAIRGEAVMANPFDLMPAVVLGGAVLAWVAGFDMLYACQDCEFDRDAKLHSIPVRLGIRGALRLAAACHAATVLLLAALPVVYAPLGGIYYLGVVAVAGLLVYEHWLVRPDDLARVNTAFFHVNAVISIGMLVITFVDLIIV